MTNYALNTVIQNSTLNESTVSGDISTSPDFMGNLLKQTFASTILPMITSVVPLNKPEGFIYTLQTYYQKNSSFDNTIYVTVANSDIFSVDDEIEWATGTGLVLHFEGIQYLLKLTSGVKPSISDTIMLSSNNATYTTILEVLRPTTLIKKIFANYSKPSITADAEYETVNELGHTIQKTLVKAKTRKIKTMLTREALTDFKNQFGEDFETIISDIIVREIIEELEHEVFNYMSDIAVATEDLKLSDSNGATTLSFVYTDIYTRMFKEIASISKTTGRNLDCFVITSSDVIAALAASGALTWAKSGEASAQTQTRNSNYVGTALGVIDIFQNDFPSSGNEVIVGYKSKTNAMGDAGIVFSPYNVTPYFAIDPETGNDTLFVMVRYNFTRNILDSGSNVNDSDYFRKFFVDFSGVKNY